MKDKQIYRGEKEKELLICLRYFSDDDARAANFAFCKGSSKQVDKYKKNVNISQQFVYTFILCNYRGEKRER